MITGECAIDKTSLLLYLKALARGHLPFNSVTLKFLALDLDVDTNSTQLGLIRRIRMHLNTQLGQSEPARNFLQETWPFLQRLRIMDSGVAARPEDGRDPFGNR